MNLVSSLCVILLFAGGLGLYHFYSKNTYFHYEIELTLFLFPIAFTASILSSSPLFRHLLLRIDLSREKKIPLRFVTFLDYAASLQVLEKDGGHWRFRHQNLQEYFAKLDAEVEPDRQRSYFRDFRAFIKDLVVASQK